MHHFSYIVQCCITVFPLCMKHSELAPVSLRPPPACSDWSAHTCLIQHCSQCLWSALFCFHLPVSIHFYQDKRHGLCKCVTWWHRIKGGTTEEAVQRQCFLWERVAPVDVNLCNTMKKEVKKKKKKKNNWKNIIPKCLIKKRHIVEVFTYAHMQRWTDTWSMLRMHIPF